MENISTKIFLIVNLSYFGDVILTNVLCQNIKQNYPNSKIVFLVNKPFYEAAKYQKFVDEVLTIDKRGRHRGLIGLLKFIYENKRYYKMFFASFIIYGNARGILISYLLGAKYRISGTRRITKYLLTHLHKETDNFKSMQDINGNFIKALTGEKTQILPIEYITNNDYDTFIENIKQSFLGKEVIGLCCVSKLKEKDMPVNTAIDIINLANKEEKIILYLGAGEESRTYADNLKKSGCVNFIDLTNITSIKQLAEVLTICKTLISVDTGTMHLACAVGTPVVCTFYKKEMVDRWAPRDFLYKSKVLTEDFSAENIYRSAIGLSKDIDKNRINIQSKCKNN